MVEHLNWRTIGHLEMGLRSLGDPIGEADPLVTCLTTATAASVAAANERSATLNAAPAALLVERAPWAAEALLRRNLTLTLALTLTLTLTLALTLTLNLTLTLIVMPNA